MQLDPNDIYERLVSLGEQWAETHEAAEYLEETKKSLLSQLGAEVDGSQAAKEAYALRHPEYTAHVKLMCQTRKAANKAKVRYDAAKVWADLMRTVSANERAALKSAP